MALGAATTHRAGNAAEEGQAEGEREDGEEDQAHETAQIRLLHHRTVLQKTLISINITFL